MNTRSTMEHVAIMQTHHALKRLSPVIPNIYVPLLLSTIWSCFICTLHLRGYPVAIETTVVSLLNIPIAMLLGFRTNRSFDRYWQGAQLWTNLVIHLRNCSRLVWNGIQCPHRAASPSIGEDIGKDVNASIEDMLNVGAQTSTQLQTPESKQPRTPSEKPRVPKKRQNRCVTVSEKERQERLMILKHIYAIALSTKDALIHGNPYHNPHLPSLLPKDPVPGSLGDISPPSVSTYYMSLPNGTKTHASQRQIIGSSQSQNAVAVALSLVHTISRYHRTKRQANLIDADDSTLLGAAISGMSDSLTKLEQFLSLQLPPIFQTHLRHILLLYFLTLPIQLLKPLGLLTIPATAILCFCFVGVEFIAAELQDPFGNDEMDVNLDHLVGNVKRDIEEICGWRLVDEDETDGEISEDVDENGVKDLEGEYEHVQVEEKKIQ